MPATLELLLAAYLFAAVGLDLAVGLLCVGWPRGELWPLAERYSGASMLASAVAAMAAGMLTVGLAPTVALRVFLCGALAALIAGICGAVPDDAPAVGQKRMVTLGLATPLAAIAVYLPTPTGGGHVTTGAPHIEVDVGSLLPFAALCFVLALMEGYAILRYWPRSQVRAAGASGVFVLALGVWDALALSGIGLPLLGAVTATAIVAAYIAWRMRTQLAVALQGIEGRVPGYALKRYLGAGGMAEVFLAESAGLIGPARLTAVKRVRRDLVDDTDLCTMFMEEARLASQLHHPHIVEVYAHGEGSGRPYIAMELVQGVSLSRAINHFAHTQREIPLSTVVEIGIALCSALAYAHALLGPDGAPLNIVHRDVSPHNVLLGRDGSIKLIDFGIARARTRESHTQVGKVRGKVAYAAPEQLGGGELDARTDIFALGVSLYEAVALRRPFGSSGEPGTVRAILTGRFPALADLRFDAARLAVPIERAMSHDPAERFDDAQAFGAALRDAWGEPAPGPASVASLVATVEAEADLVKVSSGSSTGGRRYDTSVDTAVDEPGHEPA